LNLRGCNVRRHASSLACGSVLGSPSRRHDPCRDCGADGITPLHVERIVADALYRLDCDVCEQERGVTISPARQYIRERCRDLRLRVRVWRDRF